MATCGNGTSLTTSPTTIFATTDGPCATFVVSNRSGSTNNALINVQGLHGASDFFGIAPGSSQPFRCGTNGVIQVIAKSDGTATIDWGVVARF